MVKAILLIPLLARIAIAATQASTATVHLAFTERSPLSQMKMIGQRQAFKKFARGADHFEYDLVKESFEAFVPQNYKPGANFGIFVFISAGDAQLTPGWGEVFARHKL